MATANFITGSFDSSHNQVGKEVASSLDIDERNGMLIRGMTMKLLELSQNRPGFTNHLSN